MDTYRVGREGPEEDGVEAFIERGGTFLSEQSPEDIEQTSVLPLSSCSNTHTHAVDSMKSHLSLPVFLTNSPVWKLDLRTSGGRAMVQLRIPATPPARRVLTVLSWVAL